MAPSGEHGYRAEEAVREIAAVLGLPDLVYVAELSRHRVSGAREVGDGLLIANGRGAIVQVKARAGDEERDKAQRWVRKHVARAIRQGRGSANTIELARDRGEPLVVTPVRCLALDDEVRERFVVSLDELDVRQWLQIVVIDAPAADGLELELPDGVFIISLGDWHEVHLAIRSVTGLLEYVERVIEANLHVPLGEEQARYRAVVEADAEYSKASGRDTSRPWFSLDNLASPMGAQLYRELVERVWPLDAPMPAVEPEDYRAVVELLDAVPPGVHVELGEWILRKRYELSQGAGRSSGLFVTAGLPPIVYLCADHESFPAPEDFTAELGVLTAVRAEQFAEQTGGQRTALGIGHRVDPGGVDHLYVLVRGLADVPDELRAEVEERLSVARFDTAVDPA